MIFMRHRPEGWSHGLGFLRERKSRVSAREEKSGSGLVLVDGRILTRSTRHTNNRYIVAIPFGYRNGSGGRCRWTFDSVGASGEPPNTSIVAVVAKEQFHFTQTILRRDRRIQAVRVYNRTMLQAVCGRGLADFGQSDGRADSGKVVQYEPTKHMAQCVRVPLRNIVAIATPQS
jgi:hypothetical protein